MRARLTHYYKEKPLTSPQRQQLHAALHAAFDEDALKRMLAFELDTDLDAVV